MRTSARVGLALAVGTLALVTPARARQADRRVANLHAFARLYGVVRFFHPSDEAAAVGWERLAILGSARVKDARTTDALLACLDSLFRPIAPSVILFREGAAPPPPRHLPRDTAGARLVAWQHQGVLINPSRPNVYWSIRTNRTATMAVQSAGFGTITQMIDAQPYRGRRIRLRAQVRPVVDGPGNQAALWLRVDRDGARTGFFDNMGNRPITDPAWRTYEVSGRVDDDAVRVAFGAMLQGMGEVRVDAVELAVQAADSSWSAVSIADPGFEAGDTAWSRAAGANPIRPGAAGRWLAASPGFIYETATGDAPAGRRAATIRTRTTTRTEPLFAAQPPPGDVVEVALGAGLRARVPVSLYTDGVGTLPRGDSAANAALRAGLAMVDARASADSEDVRLADVVIAWNVFQHFYPYFDVVLVDWPAELDRALSGALADRTGREFQVTLQRLVARLGDGHGNVFNPRYAAAGDIPWRLEWIEDRVVVTASHDSAVRRGDVVRTIDGVPAPDLVRRAESLISGSPQWKRVRALQELALGARDSVVRVVVERDGRRLDLAVVRRSRQPVPEFNRPVIAELEPGIWYVNLDQAAWSTIDSAMARLATATGVIFDLRGYPAGNHAVLRHLLPSPDTSAAWMRVPEVIYPDRRLAGYRDAGWEMQPDTPHIGGRVAFITDGRAISYAESLMGLVEHYRLGAIVGQPTAGANGNVNPTPLPGGFLITWTGMRVVKHDGSQHHLVGIRPTVPAMRTLRGVRDGRDELLEAALRVVRAVP